VLLGKLQGVEYTQHFFDIPSERKMVDRRVVNHTLPINDEETPQGDPGFLEQHTVFSGNFLLLFIFFIGNRLNQTVFMNNIFPQAFFTGSAKFLMAVSLPLLVSPSPPLGQTIQTAFICALTTALFAFPILSYLNSLQEHFQSSTGSITS